MIPVLLFIVVVLIRSEIGPSDDKFHPVEYFEIWTENKVINQSKNTFSNSLLLYAPQNNFTTKIMSIVSSQLKKEGK